MNREILRLAIPNIISNISVPLLSTVDTALMGRMSEVHIGAVGVGAMIFNFVYWNFGFLRMGTTGLTAQAFGKKDDSAMVNTFGRAILVVAVIAVVILLFQYPIGELSFILMNTEGEQRALVGEYFYIRVWAAPATLASYAIMGWFFGMQNAIYPLILTVVVNVVNIVMSFFLVHQMGMDVDGVAYGTLIAQYVGLLLGIFLIYWKYRALFIHFKKAAILKWEELKRFLQLNVDIFLRTFCITFVFAFFYSKSTAEGEMILAVNVILMQFFTWMSYGIDGFAYASESLVGKYAGANDESKTNQAIRLIFIWGMGMAAVFAIGYFFFGDIVLRLFTNQEDVILAAGPFLIWMILFPLLSTPCFLWDGIFIGLTASKAMRNSMVMAMIVFFIVYYLAHPVWDNHGLWLAMLVFMIARSIFQHYMYWKKGMALS